MADTGWIKVFRSLKDWEWYKDLPVKALFLELLLRANHRDQQWQGRVIKTGQCMVGRKQLAYDTGLTEQQVRTALKKLQNTGEITTESTNKFTIITVVNYSQYQDSEVSNQPTTQPTDNQQVTNNQPTDNQQVTTNKNDKNDKNVRNKEDIYLTVLSLFHETCPSFPQVRSLSENRKKAISARLKKYTLDDFRLLFEKAEASDFLKGNNSRNWSATFDWLIKDSNMPKVLEGNYDNRTTDKSDRNGNDWSFADYA